VRLVPGVVALLLIAPLARAGTPVAGFTDTAEVTGLNQPTAVAFLPNGDLLITERQGAFKRFNGTSTVTLATIPVCSTVNEQGLLGVAVDPNFNGNGFVYLYRTAPAPNCGSPVGRQNEIFRVTVSGNTAGSLTSLLTGMRTEGGGFHNGGGLRIGPDGKLYASVGDTGVGDNNCCCPGMASNPYAQDLNALEGKLLRLNLDGTIPADNPFVGQVGKRAEIFASGFRNPFRFGFDPATGALWLGDVGDFTIEELDVVTAGGDYGWPQCEGTLPAGCAQPGDVAPTFQYAHSAFCPGTAGLPQLGATVIGGSFAPAGFASLGGHYFFADYVDSTIYDAVLNGPRNAIVGTPTDFVTNAAQPVDLVFGPDDALYYAAIGAGEVRRVAPIPTGTSQPVSGRKLRLKANGDPGKRRLTALSKDPAITLSDNPTVSGGTLRVTGSGFDDTYPLPAGNWASVSGGYLYQDRDVSEGPIRLVVIRNGAALKVVGKGAGLGHTLAANPSPVAVVLTVDDTEHCMSFGGTVHFVANKVFTAKNASAPASCP
jgi:glucose/arabinose dehydrogenase